MTLPRREFLSGLGGAVLASALPQARAADEPAKKPIKVGQIGVGHSHAGKLGVYRKSAEYEVVGVVEPDAELRKRAETQEAFRGVTWLTREQLLSDAGVQAVLVETRVADLLETAEACVAAGKHVHIDKPPG